DAGVDPARAAARPGDVHGHLGARQAARCARRRRLLPGAAYGERYVQFLSREAWVTTVARSKQSSGKKRGSGQRPVEFPGSSAAGAGDKPHGRSSRRAILITISVLVALLVAGGLTFELSTGLLRNALRGGETTVATFVGSETCAGCHRDQAALWRTS